MQQPHEPKKQKMPESEYLKYKKILDNNKAYVQKQTQKDPTFFQNLGLGQHPKYLLIGCSDSRVPPNTIIEAKPGEIFVHRNIANQVILSDFSVNSVIQYAVEHLKVMHIIVCGHTFCGGCQAAYEKSSLGGMLDIWLSQVKSAIDKNKDALQKIESKEVNEKLKMIARYNVQEQVRNVWKIPYVQEAWKSGRPVWVHGWVYHVETGLVEDVMLETSLPEEMRSSFELIFKKQQG